MKKLFLTLFILLFANPCLAAIALGGTASTGTADSSSLTISHTTDGSANLLVVFVGNETGTQYRQPSGCTWNGTAMTLVGPTASSDGRNYAAMCYLVDPDIGTYDAVISMSGWCEITGIVQDFTGVDTTTVANETDTSTAESAFTITNTLTTSSANGWVIDVINAKDATPNFSAQSSQTTIGESANSGGSDVIASYKLIASPASTDITWNHDQTSTQGQLISIYPSGAVAARRVMITQ